MSNTVTVTDNTELIAKIKAFFNKYVEDHWQELYPSGGLPAQAWHYEVFAEFVIEELKSGKKNKN
jgi:hypothetical protein